MKGRKGAFPLLLAVLLGPVSAGGAVHYVAHPRFGVSSPQPPYDDLTKAAANIGDALAVSESGDSVLVAGVPFEDFLAQAALYFESIRIPEGVVLLGGWDYLAALGGVGTGENQRVYDIDSLWTVLRPPDQRAVVFSDSTIAEIISSDSVYSFEQFDTIQTDTSTVIETTTVYDTISVYDTTYASTPPDSNTVLRGFEIRDAISPETDGSGIYVSNGSPSIEFNVFVNNQSPAARGGAIFVGNGSPRILHNTFAFCRSSRNAGVVHVVTGSPVIKDNIFYNTSKGFAVACDAGADSVVLTYNAFFENGGNDTSGCAADETNLFSTDPAFCEAFLARDFRIFEESFLNGAASDGLPIGAWGKGCRATKKYVWRSNNRPLFPYNVPENAAQSISEALGISQAGDTILVAIGSYEESLELIPGIVLIGGFDIRFSLPQPSLTLGGTILDPANDAKPLLRVLEGGDSVFVSYLVLTGSTTESAPIIVAENSTVQFEHVTVADNNSAGAMISAGSGGRLGFTYSLFTNNSGGAVFSCDGDGEITLNSCNLAGNDEDVAPGCTVALNDTTSFNPLFCDSDGRDFRLYSESALRNAAPGAQPIGALGKGCNFAHHYVDASAGAGVFPYETPEHATSDIHAALAVVSDTDPDTIRIAAGTYETNITLTKGVTLEGGWTDQTFTERDPVPWLTVISGVQEGEPTIEFTSPTLLQRVRSGLLSCTVTHNDGVTGPGIVVSGAADSWIRQNRIVGNHVDHALHPEHLAAGMHIRGDEGAYVKPVVEQNTIVDNILTNSNPDVPSGGGVYMERADGSTGRIYFSMNIVSRNKGGRGGVILNQLRRDFVSNIAFANLDSAGVESNYVKLQGGLPASNVEEDPGFCDPDSGDYQVSTCSPAADTAFSATGDTTAGAFPISSDPACVCSNEVFLIFGLAGEPGFPFRAPHNAATKISQVTPFLSPGDTVKATRGGMIRDSFELVQGVIYKGGYDVDNLEDSRRDLTDDRSRLSGDRSMRILRVGSGVDSTTLVERFEFLDGFADTGAAVLLTGDASPTFRDNLFIGNTATMAGAALYTGDEAKPRLENNLIYRNRVEADEGGTVHLAGGGGVLVNNTLSDNEGNVYTDGSWGLRIDNCTPEVYNNTITFNLNGVWLTDAEGTVFDHNNIFHHRKDYSGFEPDSISNISANPLYCRRGLGRYTVFDHSPLVTSAREGGVIGSRPVECNTPIHYVSLSGSNTYPYDTEMTAARSIQDAIDVAVKAGFSSVDSVDEIRVAEGVYVENIILPTNVKMIGGYADDFLAENRDPATHATILQSDPDATQPVIVVEDGARSSAPGETAATLIDGFVVTGGRSSTGGGVSIGRDARPTIRNNVFRDNEAQIGGALYASPGAVPKVNTNTFSENTADEGAALYIDSVSSTLARYESNTFVGNHTAFDTAGVIHGHYANVKFRKNVVAFSARGAGYTSHEETPANVDQNLFYQNANGDSVDFTSANDPVHLIADPGFCDMANGDYSLLYDTERIRAGNLTGAIRDSCARIWWGARGAGCTRPGHRFLVRKEPDAMIFPYVCKENASPTIGQVLAIVNAGDTVEVAGGGGESHLYPGNLYLNRPIVLRGGWNNAFSLVPDTANPDSTAPNPDSTATRTIIEPSGDGPLLVIEQDSAAATDSTLLIDSRTVIEGFIFRRGKALLANGGAIQCVGGASPTIRSNVFLKNLTDNWGGAIAVRDGKAPRIYDNYISENSAGTGGAIHIFRTEDPVVRENIVVLNDATQFGGIRLEEVNGGSIDNNVIYQNAAGGISLSEPAGSLTIANNVVVSNGGRGMSLLPYFSGIQTPTLSHNDVWSNTDGSYLNLLPGEGDLSTDPQFCNVEQRTNRDNHVDPTFFRYQECSPLLDAGRDPAGGLDAHIGVASAGDSTCPDTTAPELTIGFLLNSTLSGIASLHIVPSEEIARDSIDLKLIYGDIVEGSADPDDPGDVVVEDTVAFDTVRVALRALDAELSIYTSDNMRIRSSDSLIVQARAVDLCRVVGSASRLFSSHEFSKGSPGTLRSTDRRAVLDVPAGSIKRNGVALMEVLERPEEGLESSGELRAVTAFYRLNLDQIAPLHPLLLSVNVSGLGVPRNELRHLAVCRAVGEEWEVLESAFDPALERVNAAIKKSGTYAVRYSEGVISEEVIPKRFALYPNMPNPFNPTTRILFDLPTRAEVTLHVYNVRGRLVRTLEDATLPAGRYSYVWNGKDNRGRSAGSGIYFYRLVAGSDTDTHKMILVR